MIRRRSLLGWLAVLMPAGRVAVGRTTGRQREPDLKTCWSDLDDLDKIAAHNSGKSGREELAFNEEVSRLYNTPKRLLTGEGRHEES